MGDDVDVEDLFRAHQQEVYVYFLRSVGDRHVAEDLTQETFTRAFTAAVRFRGDSSLRTWLFGIARNVFLKHVSRRPPERSGLDMDVAAEDADVPTRMALQQALMRLSETDREVLTLCDVLGFEPGEAASVVKVTPNALRVRLHRARARLREEYGHVGR